MSTPHLRGKSRWRREAAFRSIRISAARRKVILPLAVFLCATALFQIHGIVNPSDVLAATPHFDRVWAIGLNWGHLVGSFLGALALLVLLAVPFEGGRSVLLATVPLAVAPIAWWMWFLDNLGFVPCRILPGIMILLGFFCGIVFPMAGLWSVYSSSKSGKIPDAWVGLICTLAILVFLWNTGFALAMLRIRMPSW